MIQFPLVVVLAIASPNLPVTQADASATTEAVVITQTELVEVPCLGVCDEEILILTDEDELGHEQSAEESTSGITGAVDLKTAYVFPDGSTSTPSPVVQGWLSIDLGQGFSLETFGSKGLEENIGDEFDIGFTYTRDLGNGFTGSLILNHYVLFGNVSDMKEVTVAVEKNGFRGRATYNPWGDGLEDGFILGAGYDFKLTPRLSGRADVLYVTGFEATDAVVASVGLRYDLGGGFTAMADVFVPSREDESSRTRIVFGLSRSF